MRILRTSHPLPSEAIPRICYHRQYLALFAALFTQTKSFSSQHADMILQVIYWKVFGRDKGHVMYFWCFHFSIENDKIFSVNSKQANKNLFLIMINHNCHDIIREILLHMEEWFAVLGLCKGNFRNEFGRNFRARAQKILVQWAVWKRSLIIVVNAHYELRWP